MRSDQLSANMILSSVVTLIRTDIPSQSAPIPSKLPHRSTACFGSRATRGLPNEVLRLVRDISRALRRLDQFAEIFDVDKTSETSP